MHFLALLLRVAAFVFEKDVAQQSSHAFVHARFVVNPFSVQQV